MGKNSEKAQGDGGSMPPRKTVQNVKGGSKMGSAQGKNGNKRG